VWSLEVDRGPTERDQNRGGFKGKDVIRGRGGKKGGKESTGLAPELLPFFADDHHKREEGKSRKEET